MNRTLKTALSEGMREEKPDTTSATHVEGVNDFKQEQYEECKTTETNVQSVTLANAIAKDNLSKWSVSMWKLYGIMGLIILNGCMNGYDGSLMGSMNAMEFYHSHFKIGNQGGGTGIVFAIYSVGSLVGAFFAGSASDKYGRRFGMFTGSTFIVIGMIVEATAPNINQFIGGRFLIGFGMTMSQTAAPAYLVELAYPSWRGLFGGLYNVVGYYVGALACTWTTFGTGYIQSDWSWRIPTILQAVPSLIVMLLIWFMPESPRWLFANKKSGAAKAILVKYHGNGNPDSAVVLLEINEITGTINHEIETSDKRWWDYRQLFNNRASLYRIWLLLLVSVLSQFIGGSVISYYMPVMLTNVGITSLGQQRLLNALNVVFSFISGICGSFVVDRWGRRTLFLYSTFLTGLCYIAITVIASFANGHISLSVGYVFIAFIFLYGILFSFGTTPLQALYPAEILTQETRAKGLAFQGFCSGLGSFINLYATPISLENLGWKTYIIFLVFHFVEWALMYLTLVETKGRSLEELEEIFENPKPVKASLQRHKVVIAVGQGVKVEMS